MGNGFGISQKFRQILVLSRDLSTNDISVNTIYVRDNIVSDKIFSSNGTLELLKI